MTVTTVPGCLRPFRDIQELSPQNLPSEGTPVSCSKFSCKTPEDPMVAVHTNFDPNGAFSSYHWACKTCVQNAISDSLRRTSEKSKTVTWAYPSSSDPNYRIITEVMIRCLACPATVVLNGSIIHQRMDIDPTKIWLGQRSPGSSETPSDIVNRYFPPLGGASAPLSPNASVVAFWRGTARHLGRSSSYAEGVVPRSRSAESNPSQTPPAVIYGSYFGSV